MIDRTQALTNAVDHVRGILDAEARVVDGSEARVNVYGLPLALGDCWVVYIPRLAPGDLVIGSSLIVIVSKENGEIVYYGNANDEG